MRLCKIIKQCVLIAVCGIGTVFASESPIGKKIHAVHFSGLKRISADAILSKIGTQTGSVVDAHAIRLDIQALYETQYFDEIVFTSQDVDEFQVDIQIEFQERPIIQQIDYEGNTQFESSQFKDVVKVKVFDILDRSKIKNDVASLQKFYEEKGFTLAKVSFEIDVLSDNQVKLRYKIKEFDKLRIKKIRFINNEKYSDHQLKKVFLETKEGHDFSFLTSDGSFKENSFRQDLQRLRLWYWDHGYVQFRHDEPIVTMSDDKQFIYISLYVEEGECFNQGIVGFEGDLLFSMEKLKEGLALETGHVFRITQQQADITKLQEMYQDLGYAFVNVIPKTSLRIPEKLIDVIYEFEKGDLVHFGEIRILGNDKTYDRVIRRELKIHEGQLYHGSHYRISRENVERLGFFAPNEVFFNTVAVADRTDVLDVEIKVKERPTGTVNFGAGAGSLQGFFLQAQVSEMNLFGRGQNLSLSAQYSLVQVNRGLNFGFFEPYLWDTRYSAGTDVYYTSFAIPNRYTTSRTGFDVKLGHPIFEYASVLGTYRLEGDKVLKEPSLNTISQAAIDADTGVLSSVQVQLIRDKRNNRLEPTSGNYQMASFEYAGLGGDMKFLKWILNNRVYARVIGDLVFRNNAQIGQITGFDHRMLPPSHKFYLGGAGDMKGFQVYQLGPKDTSQSGINQPIGGSFIGYTLCELEYPVLREVGLKGLLFFDLGNNWDALPTFSNFVIRADYGFGLRLFLPMGHLQFTWGWPIARRADESEGPVFQLFFGPPF